MEPLEDKAILVTFLPW